MSNRQLYRTMVRIRMVEEHIVAVYPQQEIRSPTHLYIGQEAVAAGVCGALRPDDALVANYRSHGWYLAKGGSLEKLVDELHGRATGCSGGWGGSMHLIDVAAGVMGTSAIVAGGIPHALGIAFADRMLGRSSVAVVAFGDGAVEEGGFHESMNFAALRKLPVIFVCENNLWAAMSPLADRQPPVDIHRRAEGYGVASAFVQDGNDVIAVHEAMAAAVARARAGGGPTLLECRTYRWLEHCGPNDDTVPGFRDTAELAAWRARCPIERARKLVSEAEDRQFRAEIAREIHDAFAHAKDKPAPVPTWSVPAWAGPTG